MASRAKTLQETNAPLQLTVTVFDATPDDEPGLDDAAPYLARLNYRVATPEGPKEGYIQGIYCPTKEEAFDSLFFSNPDILARRLQALLKSAGPPPTVNVRRVVGS